MYGYTLLQNLKTEIEEDIGEIEGDVSNKVDKDNPVFRSNRLTIDDEETNDTYVYTFPRPSNLPPHEQNANEIVLAPIAYVQEVENETMKSNEPTATTFEYTIEPINRNDIFVYRFPDLGANANTTDTTIITTATISDADLITETEADNTFMSKTTPIAESFDYSIQPVNSNDVYTYTFPSLSNASNGSTKILTTQNIDDADLLTQTDAANTYLTQTTADTLYAPIGTSGISEVLYNASSSDINTNDFSIATGNIAAGHLKIAHIGHVWYIDAAIISKGMSFASGQHVLTTKFSATNNAANKALTTRLATVKVTSNGSTGSYSNVDIRFTVQSGTTEVNLYLIADYSDNATNPTYLYFTGILIDINNAITCSITRV